MIGASGRGGAAAVSPTKKTRPGGARKGSTAAISAPAGNAAARSGNTKRQHPFQHDERRCQSEQKVAGLPTRASPSGHDDGIQLLLISVMWSDGLRFLPVPNQNRSRRVVYVLLISLPALAGLPPHFHWNIILLYIMHAVRHPFIVKKKKGGCITTHTVQCESW